MKIDFVNPPRTFVDRSEIAPPLGLLRLAAVGRQQGFDVSISDLNLHVHDQAVSQDAASFYAAAVEYLLSKDADVYCFTSMCVDSHVALHLARLLKESRPAIVTVLGGTHFSAIASNILATYDWIDYVATGEGEFVIKNLRSTLTGTPRRSVLGGQPMHQVDARLPLDLVDRTAYFSVNPNRNLDFETARGCRYKCAFCYSPEHYNGFRNFDIEKTTAELDAALSQGFQNVFFVEDNFLNDPSRAVALCRSMAEMDRSFNWSAYVTFPDFTPACVKAMSKAGCTAVFAGIDAVGTTSRREYKKSFVRSAEDLTARIRLCRDHGITPTCAFLLTPPSQRGGNDLLETLRLALTARMSGAQIRLNTLTVYNQTGISRNGLPAEFDPLKSQLMLDVPPAIEENSYAVQHPEMYPFHARHVPRQEWADFLSVSHCLFTLYELFPTTLDAAWNRLAVTPPQIAHEVLGNMDRLIDIPRAARREAELLAATEVLEKLSSQELEVANVLDMESASILEYV